MCLPQVFFWYDKYWLSYFWKTLKQSNQKSLLVLVRCRSTQNTTRDLQCIFWCQEYFCSSWFLARANFGSKRQRRHGVVLWEPCLWLKDLCMLRCTRRCDRVFTCHAIFSGNAQFSVGIRFLTTSVKFVRNREFLAMKRYKYTIPHSCCQVKENFSLLVLFRLRLLPRRVCIYLRSCSQGFWSPRDWVYSY